MLAANDVFQEDGDGLTIVNFIFGVAVEAALGSPAAQFDPNEFIYLADPEGGAARPIWVRTDAGIDTADEWLASDEPLIFGTTGLADTFNFVPKAYEFLGFPVEIIAGYGGSAEITTAIEQGELNAHSDIALNIMSTAPHLIEDGIIKAIITSGEPEEEFAHLFEGLPTAEEYADTQLKRDFLNFTNSLTEYLRLYAVPPGTPDDRVEALRNAFESVLDDPEFLADMEQAGRALAFRSGAQVQEDIAAIAAAPDEVKDAFRELLGISQ